MTDVDIKTIEGKTALTDRMQIGLAYGYGDGEIVSCENFTLHTGELRRFYRKGDYTGRTSKLQKSQRTGFAGGNRTGK